MSQTRRTVADEPFLVVRSSVANPHAGLVIPHHAHAWHQLIYAAAGIITVWTEAGSWVAPPTWAIWAPAAVQHGIRFAGKCAFRTLYFRPEHWPNLPGDCTAVTVSPLLHHLILRTTEQGMLDQREPVDGAIATLMLDEFCRADVPPFNLPQPASALTRQAATLLTAPDARNATTETIAHRIGIGARTLERRFVTETGITLGSWRQHHALLASLEHLAAGMPVKTAAASAGYATPSAYVAAFRALFGTTPGRYFDRPPAQAT